MKWYYVVYQYGGVRRWTVYTSEDILPSVPTGGVVIQTKEISEAEYNNFVELELLIYA